MLGFAQPDSPLREPATVWLLNRMSNDWAEHGLRPALKAAGIYDPDTLTLFAVLPRSDLTVQIAYALFLVHLVLLGLGSLVGLLIGVFASSLLGQIVYQANPRDPVVLAGAVLTMALLGVAASAIPALRALAVDPAKLMREE